ncbi:MAG: dockerin type I repeat-containing protein, partial [candidate division Zixibacteria bacterium]|nr:dockerin type I repeat-containing protein [candidate division Zixibacteria bacterium]
MVACETGGATGDPQTVSYYRRVGGYGIGSGTWSSQKLVDTVMNINPILAASQTTGKVAIVWNAPVDYVGNDINRWGQYENDVWYALSTDRGASFMALSGSIGHAVATSAIPGANITKYEGTSQWKAYCDMAAVITSDENLHIVWGCRKWTDTTSLYRRQSAIFHWSQDVPYIRTVVKAEWDTGGTGTMYAWGSDAAKMSIAECDSRLYVLYTQFGNADQPSADYSANKKVMNGELYMTASNNSGMNWDAPQNLTNSPSPLCADGDCNSDYWASMARYGRTDANGCEGITAGTKVLDIEYINDKSAGGCVQTESGIWTTNPVMWFATPCRDVVAEPGYNDNAGTGYGECYADLPLLVSPDGDTTIILTMENNGLADNSFSIATSYTDGAGWITPVPASGVISSGLVNTVDVQLTFTAPAGAPDPSAWVGKITVTHQASGSPREIPVCMTVASVFYYPESVVLETTCKKIKLWNDGHMVNNAGGYALDFIGDCDTFNVNITSNIYLYDGSPIVCYVKGDDTLRYMAYSYTFTDEFGLRPMVPWTLGDSSFYWKASCEYSTADTAIGFIADYYSSKDASKCSFIIQKLRFFNLTETAINGVLVGEVLDWDIPSDTGSRNGSGFDLTRDMIYQFGGEYNDTLENLCAQNSNDRYGAIAAYPGTTFMNAFTVDNATYVYNTTSPWTILAPFPPGAMYEKMLATEGFDTWSSSDPDSEFTDLSTVVTFGQYDLIPGDTFTVVKVLSTSKTGLTYLNAQVDLARNGGLWSQTCCNKAGDANNDNKVNVGDAVYIISYVFRGGPAPVCPAEGNANGDLTPQGANKINVGDAVYIISYVFRGGPAPVCGVGL